MSFELDDVSVASGRRLGRIEILLWCQEQIQNDITEIRSLDRFADTRALEDFLTRVRDMLHGEQDGSDSIVGVGAVPIADSSEIPDTQQGSDEMKAPE